MPQLHDMLAEFQIRIRGTQGPVTALWATLGFLYPLLVGLGVTAPVAFPALFDLFLRFA